MTLYELLLAGSIASTTYDVETSFKAFDRCAACYEANPVMRPFADSRARMYVAQSGLNFGLGYASWHLKKEGNKWWWVPLVANIGVHFAAATHNRAVR